MLRTRLLAVTGMVVVALLVALCMTIPAVEGSVYYVYITVSSPTSAFASRLVPFAPAVFGPSIVGSISATFAAPPDPDDPLGCNPYVRNITGSVAFIRRGNCPFSTKALNAERAGAIAAVIYSCSSAAPTYCNPGLTTMTSLFDVSIPTLSIRNLDGAFLAPFVNGTVNGMQRNTRMHQS